MRRRKAWVVVVCFLLVAFSGVMVWQVHQAKHPAFKLKVVNRSAAHGKQVVTFKITGTDTRRLFINDAWFVIGIVEDSRSSVRYELPGDFPSNGTNEFTLSAPTNADVWRLRVGAAVYPQPTSGRIRDMPTAWKAARKTGQSVFSAIPIAWSITSDGPYQWIESDFITNAVSKVATNLTEAMMRQ